MWKFSYPFWWELILLEMTIRIQNHVRIIRLLYQFIDRGLMINTLKAYRDTLISYWIWARSVMQYFKIMIILLLGVKIFSYSYLVSINPNIYCIYNRNWWAFFSLIFFISLNSPNKYQNFIKFCKFINDKLQSSILITL